MISLDALNAWRTSHPWVDDDQVEQDLIMTRVAIAKLALERQPSKRKQRMVEDIERRLRLREDQPN